MLFVNTGVAIKITYLGVNFYCRGKYEKNGKQT